MPLPYVPYNANDNDFSNDANTSQLRQYQLLEQLQNLVHKLPMNVQQRLSYSFLSDIAAALLDDAVFTIVGDLKEIQHLTEKNLYSQRQKVKLDHKVLQQKLQTKQKDEILNCRPHNKALIIKEHEKQRKDLEKKQENELLKVDTQLLEEIDKKVADQQAIMQNSGVPGFFVTNDPKEVKLQMTILQLISDLKPT